jgi:hypothetical protein
MGLLENYCKFKINSILISKTSIQSLTNYPKFKSFLFFFILNLKQYKKNVLLFYLIINLILGGISFKKKKSGFYVVLKVSIKKKKIFLFLQSFINFYLPLLSSPENIYKQTIAKKKLFLVNACFYRFNYFCFPPISELELIYEDFELIYDFVSNFKFQLDVFIKTQKNVMNSGETLLRIHKFPCVAKLTKIL